MSNQTTTDTQPSSAQQPEPLDADELAWLIQVVEDEAEKRARAKEADELAWLIQVVEDEAEKRARAVAEHNAEYEAWWEARYDDGPPADDYRPYAPPLPSMHTPEEFARWVLARRGFGGIRLRPDSKARLCKGKKTYVLPLADESRGVVPPPGYVIIDTDSELGQELVDELELPETLTIKARRGWHFYFKLPDGVDLPQCGKPFDGVDVIVGHNGSYVVAPGSRAKGHLYMVEKALPIAELPPTIAQGLAYVLKAKAKQQAKQEAKPKEPPQAEAPQKMEWICENPVWVRVRANAERAKQADSRKRRKPGQDAEARRQQWLHETRDGHRHQALLRLALVALGFGWSYEQYEAEILAHPIRCKLDGQSSVWLRRYVWAKAQELYKPLSSTKTQPNRAWRRHGPGEVRRWLDRVMLLVPTRQLRDLLQLFATWAERFGPRFYLCQGLMRLWCECDWRALRDKKAGTGLLVDLLTRGLLIEHEREGQPKWQATYWDLVLDLDPSTPPPDGIADLAQGVELRILGDQDIGTLLRIYGGYDGDAFSGAMESEGSAGGLAAV